MEIDGSGNGAELAESAAADTMLTAEIHRLSGCSAQGSSLSPGTEQDVKFVSRILTFITFSKSNPMDTWCIYP